ncbi:transcriptional activator [Colletotrichum musicola]|uniref:Transcriptional activator n=2 Tax=Colletotrichum orchidearum species complex TaxID=2707337 RepID=A0A8H6N4A8_9PEZI|nr:transcriptional activator [Colletotrichum musicola]KAF6837471.1 transcriptional activator [Colletotrichum plurivorum]
MDRKTGKAGVIVAPDDAGSMERLPCVVQQAHAVLDDVMYNVVSDLLMKVHRDEKIARAATAAIRVEKLASDASESSTPDSRPDVRIETDAAIYEDGRVLLKGNPLQTTKDILCPRCHLPRLLNPTDGKGAKKPDPSVIYCKKHPYIDKPGFDIYGQTWVQPGPGRGKKKKDMKPDPNIEGAGPGESRPPNVLSFPSATCSKCKRCILVTRLNNHMGSCIGNSGRNASRAAAAKISNGSNGASQNDGTPPSSQKATPAPGSRASSPKKRDSEEVAAPEEEEESENSHKKKKLKPSAFTKKVILKTKGPKKDKVKTNSLLSHESKVDDDDDNSTVEVAPKKEKKEIKEKGMSPAKKLKLGAAKPPLSSPLSKAGNGRTEDAESESSGTLSSPPN